MICRACGTVSTGASRPKGSGWIELVLWLTFIIPIALVYSIWRRAGVRPRCAACGSEALVSLQTPAGRRLAAQHYPDGVPAAQAAPEAPVVSLAGIGRVLVLFGAALVGGAVFLLVIGPLTV